MVSPIRDDQSVSFKHLPKGALRVQLYKDIEVASVDSFQVNAALQAQSTHSLITLGAREGLHHLVVCAVK